MADEKTTWTPTDVFEQMREVEKRLATVQARSRRILVYPITRDEALWLCERVENVLRTLRDANATYGIVGDNGKAITPMMVERDALVAALAEPERWPDERAAP